MCTLLALALPALASRLSNLFLLPATRTLSTPNYIAARYSQGGYPPDFDYCTIRYLAMLCRVVSLSPVWSRQSPESPASLRWYSLDAHACTELASLIYTRFRRHHRRVRYLCSLVGIHREQLALCLPVSSCSLSRLPSSLSWLVSACQPLILLGRRWPVDDCYSLTSWHRCQPLPEFPESWGACYWRLTTSLRGGQLSVPMLAMRLCSCRIRQRVFARGGG